MANTVVSPTTGSNCATGSTDARCTATVPLTNSAVITFTKTADVAYAAPGSKVTYTITVANTALFGSVSGVSLTDPLADVLDDATYNSDATASAGTVAVTGGNLTWSAGAVAFQTTVTITYSVTVKAAISGNQILADTVTGSTGVASTNCGAGSTDPRCTATVPVARLDLQQSYTETTHDPGRAGPPVSHLHQHREVPLHRHHRHQPDQRCGRRRDPDR